MNPICRLYLIIKPASPWLWSLILTLVQFVSLTNLVIYYLTVIGAGFLLPSDHNWQAAVSCAVIFIFFILIYMMWRSVLKTFIDHGLLEAKIDSSDSMSFYSILHNSIKHLEMKMFHLDKSINKNDIRSHVENVLIDLLLCEVRHAFSILYNHSGFSVSIFFPVVINGTNTVMYEAYTTHDNHARLTYEKGEGFCGWAWEHNEPQAGARKKSIFSIISIKDKRYCKDDGSHHNKSFLCIPIVSKLHHLMEDSESDSVVAILSVKSRVTEDFKCRHSIVQQFDISLRDTCSFIISLIKEKKLTAKLINQQENVINN